MTRRPQASHLGINRLEVDLGAIAHNVREVRRVIGPDTRFFAVVKGNAYGFGSVEVGSTAIANGADALALVRVKDAVALRDAGVEAPILLYGGSLGDRVLAGTAEQYDLTVSIVDLESARFHSELAQESVRAFVEVDVGLERLGVPAEEAAATIYRILRLPRLRVEGVYAHLRIPEARRGVDNPSLSQFLSWQFDRFLRVLKQLKDAGIAIPVSMAASSPLVRFSPAMNLNGVDVGRLMYGIVPEIPARVPLQLRPAFRSLKSRLIQVKNVRRTTFVEEAGFPVSDVTRIGVMPFGLADGLSEVTCGEVLVRGKRATLLGGFLEHARIDLSRIDGTCAGDEVVIIGEQGERSITSEEVFAHRKTRMPAGLGVLVRESVERIYV